MLPAAARTRAGSSTCRTARPGSSASSRPDTSAASATCCRSAGARTTGRCSATAAGRWSAGRSRASAARSRSRARPRATSSTGPTLSPQWQWNHNPVPDAWSLAARPGLAAPRGAAASDLSRARNTLTQKLWDDAGVVDVAPRRRAGMADGQRAGFTFISGSAFGWVGVGMNARRATHPLGPGRGPGARAGTRSGCAGGTRRALARLEYSLDGQILDRHRGRVHARVRPLEGGEVRDLLLRAARTRRRRLRALSLRGSRRPGALTGDGRCPGQR